MRKYKFNSVVSIIGEYVGANMPDTGEVRQMASWDDYRTLGTNDVEYGSHTYGVHHPTTHGANDVSNEDLFFDLLESKRDIERELGVDCSIITWPYGAYNSESIRVAAAIGFKYMLTSGYGALIEFNRINRIHILQTHSIKEFSKLLLDAN